MFKIWKRKILFLFVWLINFNIPYRSLTSETWHDFFNIMNLSHIIPSIKILWKYIIDYSKFLLPEGISQFKGAVCGLLLMVSRYYQDMNRLLFWFNYQLWGWQKLFMLKIKLQQISVKRSRMFLEDCKKNEITVSRIVSDNAKLLDKAIENINPNDDSSLLTKIGMEVKRCSC